MNNIDDFNRMIAELSERKDDAIKRAEYDEAAKIRDMLDAVKMEKRKRFPSDRPHPPIDIYVDAAKQRKVAWGDEFINRVLKTIVKDWKPKELISGGRSGLRAERALRNILGVTNPDAPGIYEAITVEKVNNLARNAMGIADAPRECWSHHRPAPDDAPQQITENTQQLKQWVSVALRRLSGDLSHDNVATAKEILKKVIG